MPGDRLESEALVDFPWKLIAIETGAHGERRYELYDLAHDPFEHDNRAAAEPDRVRRLTAVLAHVLQTQAAARARFVATHAVEESGAPRLPMRNVLEQLSLGYIR